MKKTILSIAAAIVFAVCPVMADEGMWLPVLISQRIADMQAKGFKLTAEDIYSVNQASLKDAVVLFGGGCTGELVSAEGLLLTNHHCGYGQIQRHSSVEHDYLKDGFWAMNREQELPNPGLSVSFLDRMEDVTNVILANVKPSMSETERNEAISAASKSLIESVTKGQNGVRASVESLYYGNQYFLFVYRIYRDVRLVGAPASSIGKFGGDTDNWMWPRHTGDFSIFRIYADKDNNPADYSKDNVPYTPKRFFKISRAGVKEGDFTFIYGNPGSTQEYIHSDAVRYIAEISDPAKIALRTLRLDIMNKYMSQSQAVRIQYSSKYAGISNAWKKWQGEAKGINKMHTVNTKREFEAAFEKWAKGSRYEGITGKLAALYEKLEPYNFAREIYSETASTIEYAQYAMNMKRTTDEARKKAITESFMKDYYQPIDRECFLAVMAEFDKQIPAQFKPEYFTSKLAEYGSLEAWADKIFSDNLDYAYDFGTNMSEWYRSDIMPTVTEINQQVRLLYRDYMQGQMEFDKNKAFYPDANLTLRVAYGKVGAYSPADGVYYKHVSTLKGVMEKDNPDIFDYDIPQSLRDLYAQGGFEDTPVCFIASNHTTGGNSGSPVINADGNLIGINFDRVWEGTMSDIAFDPEFCRNISLDVRYLLFVVEHIGHAEHLFKEMVFVD